MTRRVVVAGIVALVAVAAWWWWPTDRRRIVAATQALVEAVSVPSSEPDLARVTRAARLSRLLAPDFRLVDAQGRIVVDGRDTAIGFATKLQPPRGLQVSVGELELEIEADRLTARARAWITLTEPGEGGIAEPTETWQAVLDWAKGDAWALSALTVSALAPQGQQKTN